MAKILFFVEGVPTPEQIVEAKQLGALIRNAKAWHPGDAMEDCDQAVGAVPEAYKAKSEEKPDEANGLLPHFEEMKVQEMRDFARERGIPIPAQVNTRDEISAYLAEALNKNAS